MRVKKIRFMEEFMYLYKITNQINGKKYIGITNNYKKRWSNHRCGNNKTMAIANAIKKYGKDNFTFEIIEKNLTLEEANQKEIEAIYNENTLVPNGYNISKGGGVIPIEKSKHIGTSNGRSILTQEQAQYILDHRNLPEYVLYEEFSEIISYPAFKDIYLGKTYTNLSTNTPIYPFNLEFSCQFSSTNKLEYDEVLELRQKYLEGIYWREVYKEYKDLYPNEWDFWNVYNGNRYKLVMPEVFTEENKKIHSKFSNHSGSNNGRSKLTEKDVREIRRLKEKENYSNLDIYKLYPQVSTTSIRNILNYKTWINIEQ